MMRSETAFPVRPPGSRRPGGGRKVDTETVATVHVKVELWKHMTDELVALRTVASAAQAVHLAAREHFPNMCYIAGELDALGNALDVLDAASDEGLACVDITQIGHLKGGNPEWSTA